MTEREKRRLENPLFAEDIARSSYRKAKAMLRRALDAKTDRLLLIEKAIAARNAALDRNEQSSQAAQRFT